MHHDLPCTNARIVAGSLAGIVGFGVTATPGRSESITVINTTSAGGYTFTNFDGPTPNSAGIDHQWDFQQRQLPVVGFHHH